MSLIEITNNLYNTPFSAGIRSISWMIPNLQSLHIVCLAFLVGSVLVMELRLLGVMAADQAPNQVVKRHLPWLWCAFAGMVFTGGLLVIAEPNRELTNTLFWWKMLCLTVAFLITLVSRRPLLKSASEQALTGAVKGTAVISLLLWVAAIFLGRWIAYAGL